MAGSHLCVKQNWDDFAGSMQDTFNADAFGTYRVKNQVSPKRHHADTFNKLVAQGGGFWHSRNFDAQFPNFSNKRNSAGWIVTGDIVADFFKIEFGKRGKNALHGLPMFRSWACYILLQADQKAYQPEYRHRFLYPLGVADKGF